MPFQMAMAVAHGRMELNEALERMSRNDRIDKLMRKHNLSRALATQIAMGQADLERVLYRRRMEEHRLANRQRSILEGSMKERLLLVLGLHGQEEVTGEVEAIDTYTIEFLPRDEEEPRSIHKLQVKYAYRPSQEKHAHGMRSVDDKLAAKSMSPLERPQDRYPCSDKRLFRYVDRRITVDATLLEGERFTGEIGWFSRYEFQMTQEGDPVVTIFRHALHDLSEAR
ncbi:MAG: hypothetical protein JRI25_04405 [Deltaproteobacteria bacterium]|nr:hypothetical protein [Deltaproteobacteria bacterium]MBW2253821.1 hypothetical protein [Deltaproteobacteria bacterium]